MAGWPVRLPIITAAYPRPAIRAITPVAGYPSRAVINMWAIITRTGIVVAAVIMMITPSMCLA